MRVEFADERVRAHVAGAVVLECTRLRRRAGAGAVGSSSAVDDLLLGELRWSAEAPALAAAPTGAAPGGDRRPLGGLGAVRGARPGTRSSAPSTRWTPLEAEPSGLADLARVNHVRDGADTVLARAVVHADRARHVPLELGFSDRAVVYLNGAALYRGDDTYRSRDYRFLGSIGWFDTVYLPLQAGPNELVLAVVERLRRLGRASALPGRGGAAAARVST